MGSRSEEKRIQPQFERSAGYRKRTHSWIIRNKNANAVAGQTRNWVFRIFLKLFFLFVVARLLSDWYQQKINFSLAMKYLEISDLIFIAAASVGIVSRQIDVIISAAAAGSPDISLVGNVQHDFRGKLIEISEGVRASKPVAKYENWNQDWNSFLCSSQHSFIYNISQFHSRNRCQWDLNELDLTRMSPRDVYVRSKGVKFT